MKVWLVIFFCIVSSQHLFAAETDERSQQADPARTILRLAGSNTLGAHLAPAWASGFLHAQGAKDTRVRPLAIANESEVCGSFAGGERCIAIAAHGSSTGFKALLAEAADLAMSSRPSKADERAQLAHYGDLTSMQAEHVVAIDGLAVIVHPASAVDALDVATLAQIFSGRIRNWAELGGTPRPIYLFARDQNSGTWDTFSNLVLGELTLHESAQRFESNDELADRVAEQPGAIGFVGLASVRDARAIAVHAGDAAPLLPEPLQVATEDYALARRLFLYSAESASRTVVEFIEFAQSEAGQALVEQVGFVSQNPVSVAFVPSIASHPRYRRLAEQAERLSINFRFREGSAELDNKAKQDALRLARYLGATDKGSVKLQLVGFSDTARSRDTADALARLRASAVKFELFKHGVSSEPIVAFGADKPVADSSSAARARNNRVEVWLLKEPSGGARDHSGGPRSLVAQ